MPFFLQSKPFAIRPSPSPLKLSSRLRPLARTSHNAETAKNAVPQFFAVESGHRFYSPELGRWLSRDPIGERGGICLYVFLANNAVNSWDMLGLEIQSDDMRDLLKKRSKQEACQMLCNILEDAKLSSAAYGNNQDIPLGYKLGRVWSNAATGFEAREFIKTDAQGQILDRVVAFAGTKFEDFKGDWRNNIRQGLNQLAEQYDTDLRRVLSAIGQGYRFVGHSLGGGLAHSAAINKRTHAVTFNAAGLSKNQMLLVDEAPGPETIRATDIFTDSDALTNGQDAIMGEALNAGSKIRIPDSEKERWYEPGAYHAIEMHPIQEVIRSLNSLLNEFCK